MEEIWISSMTNSWSMAYPTSIGIGIILLICISFIKNVKIKIGLIVIIIFSFSIFATISSSLEISETWRIREACYQPRWDTLTDIQKRILGHSKFKSQKL